MVAQGFRGKTGHQVLLARGFSSSRRHERKVWHVPGGQRNHRTSHRYREQSRQNRVVQELRHSRSARSARSRRRPVPSKSCRLTAPGLGCARNGGRCSHLACLENEERFLAGPEATDAEKLRFAVWALRTSQVFSHLQRIVWISASIETCVAEKPLIENFWPLASVKRKKRLMW